jgi:hypothetical protein
MFKRDEPIISFVSTVPGLENIEDTRPKPAKEFMPSWWKTMPKADPKSNVATIKTCPAISDYFSDGYIIPMWADTSIKYDKELDEWRVFCGRNGQEFPWSMHFNSQALDHATFKTFGQAATFIFKAVSPWKIITRKGWSVYQLPTFYHFDNDFSIMPGTRDTDIYHNLNAQVLYHGDGEEVHIKQGQPFIHIVPFKRTKTDMDVRYQTEKDKRILETESLRFSSIFLADPIRGTYRKMQKRRDKEL